MNVRRRCICVALLVVVVNAGCASDADEAALRRMNALYLGVQQYDDAFHRLPCDVLSGADHSRIASWRLAVTPYVWDPPYPVDLSVSWDDAANSAMRSEPSTLFELPKDGMPAGAGPFRCVSVVFDPVTVTQSIDRLPKGMPFLVEWDNHELKHWSQPGDVSLVDVGDDATLGTTIASGNNVYMLTTDGLVYQVDAAMPARLLKWSLDMTAQELDSHRMELRRFVRFVGEERQGSGLID